MAEDKAKDAIVPTAIDAAAAAAVAAVPGGGAPAVAVAAGAVIVGSLTKVLVARRERRLGAFVHEYFEIDADTDPAVLEAKIHAMGDEPAVQEAVLEAVRGIDEALADVVVPALARLARLYTMSKRPADGFFRGMRRVLQDLNAEGFAVLIALLRSFKDDTAVFRELEAGPDDRSPMPRIIFLLRTNWLAGEQSVGVLGSAHGVVPPREGAILSRDAALQILAVIDSAEELRWVVHPRR